MAERAFEIGGSCHRTAVQGLELVGWVVSGTGWWVAGLRVRDVTVVSYNILLTEQWRYMCF